MTVKALKRVSTRDSLAKTVRLLVKEGITVQFRGRKAFVETRGNKVIRMVLPEIGDDATDLAMKALHGYLDHECGHIFYTPFGKQADKVRNNKMLQKMTNIIEDIRLEKLLPRDLPGTKTNLENLYEWVIPDIFAKHARDGANSGNPTAAFGGVMIPALRALAGQRQFQKFMDDEQMWPHFMPLLSKMPDLSRRLRSMETFDDALNLATDIIKALEPPKKDTQDADPDAEKSEDDPQVDIDQLKSDCEGEGEADPDDDADEGDESDSDEPSEGDGDGKGTASEDAENKDNCSGEDESGEDENGNGAGDNEETGEGGPEGDEPTGTKDEGDETSGRTGDGKHNVSITGALKQLDPTQRRALFMYKKQRKTVAEISETLNVSEDQAKDLVMTARRRIREIITGG